MTKPGKRLIAGLLLAAVAGLMPSATRSLPPTADRLAPALIMPPAVVRAVSEAQMRGEQSVEVDFTVGSPAAMAAARAAVQAAGGTVLLEDRVYARARIPIAGMESAALASVVTAMGVNEQFPAPVAAGVTLGQDLTATQANQLATSSLDAIAAGDFRRQTGVSGQGITVAVVDSGIDPGHPDLLQTVGGSPKIVDWKDFTGEGRIETPQTVAWRDTYTAPTGEVYRLPLDRKPPASQSARFGFWEETTVLGKINRDLDRNGSQLDRFGVLLVDATRTGVYDTVYVDTNNNGDFNDEEPLRVFRASQDVGKLGALREGRLAARRLNFVVADLDPRGQYVTLGFDGEGHGTEVAGLLAAYSAEGFVGVAPGAQLMALKAASSAGDANWYNISSAIKYAAEHGAAIINVSIGGLAAASRYDSTASERLNQIARQYGVLIILAADNTGPGLSSGTTLGSPSEVLSVGAYYSPAMWKRDFGYVVPSEGVWMLSGMGPRSDGSYLPGLIAPGGSPTTAPRWVHLSGYTTDAGTSIATPHVSGAAALLMEAGKRSGVHYDRLSVKRALEMGARPIPGVGTYEQGYGLIALPAAFERLKQINSLPALTTRTQDGNGGLLARSIHPGNSEFWLTNLEADLTRVSVVSSEDWVRTTYSSLTLPPNVPRRLPLQVQPPTEPGVHSAFLTIHEQDTFGPSTTIPITYVQPQQFQPGPEPAFFTTDRLEVARFRRYFFAIDPGAAGFTVTTRALAGLQGTAQGTVRVQIFRPDGQAVFQSADIGARGSGLTAFFQTNDPVPGTWEVVVTALPDSEGGDLNASYTLEAHMRAGFLPSAPLRITRTPGDAPRQSLWLVNTKAPFTGNVQAIGLSKVDPSQPWRVLQRVNVVDDFTLSEAVGRIRLEISNPVPSDLDLDLELYRYDPQSPGGYTLIRQSLTRAASNESIEIANLPSGRYQVNVAANGVLPARLQYQYRRLMAVEGYQLSVDDPVRKHDLGEAWSPTLVIANPPAPGRYFGTLLVRDAEGKQTLGWIPFEVSVGQPALTVEALSPQLTLGRPSNIDLAVRDSRTGAPVDVTMTVDGQVYTTRSGQVSLTVQPAGTDVVLQVEVNQPAYQFLQTEIHLAAHAAWAPHPTGLGGGEENAIWRRKVRSQMP